MISDDLLALVCCPATHVPLTVATSEQLARANRPGAVRVSGEPVTREIVEGLVRADGEILYPVWDNIPCLLSQEAISLR